MDTEMSGLRERVLPNVSSKNGDLEDKSLDVDARTMAILGKRQQLNRDFGLISLIAFSTTLIASWESFACTFQGGLINGGPASLIYGLVFSFLGALATCASLAEMASMGPTSGGQYHWVAQLAPVHFATSFSWVAGWVTAFARIAVAASAAYVAGTMVQGLIILNYETYMPERWHGTMIYWAIFLVSSFVNIFGIRYFPHVETVAFMLHIVFFFIFLVPLVYLAPQSSAKFVFADFENAGGWNSNVVSWSIGMLTSAWSFVGIDGTCHMSEEVRNSAIVVPQSMMAALFISGISTIAISIAIVFGIDDVMAAITTKTKFPIIEIFYNATQSKRATTAVMATLIVTLVFATFGTLASASRVTWAFARDKGLPFPEYLSHDRPTATYGFQVNKHYMIPVRAILLIAAIGLILGLVNIASSTAFNAMTSLALIGHYTSYLLPIVLLVIRRFGKKHIPFGPWTLGRYGLAVNLFSLFYCVVLIVFVAFPPYQPVTYENMNYAAVIFGAVLILSLAMWFAYGRKLYRGPVKDVIEEMSLDS